MPRADARRNIDALLDAGLRVLSTQPRAGLAEVAREAGVTRATLYAHFASREALVEALMTRALAEATAALDEAAPEDGPAPDALRRLVAVSWERIDRHGRLLEAVGDALGPGGVRRHHEALMERIERLARRGQRAGAFRRGVPPAWLAASYVGLVHTAADAVQAGALKPGDALEALTVTVLGAFGAD